MNDKINDEERSAIMDKMKNPLKTVVCPRCGKLLQFIEIGNSGQIKCETEGCLVATWRGL